MFGQKTTKIILRFLFIPLVLLLATPLSLLTLPSQSASALTKSSEMDAPTRVTSWWYYEAMFQCLATADNLNTNAAGVASGQWFKDRGSAVAGFYMRDNGANTIDVGSDGKFDCNENNSQLSSSALKFWGINPLTFVCSVGFLRTDNTSCLSGSGDFYIPAGAVGKLKTALKSYISTSIYSGNSMFSSNVGDDRSVGGLSATEQYYFYLQTLQQSCVRGDSTLSSAKLLTSDPGGAKVYKIKNLVNINGTMTTVTGWYVGQKNTSDSISAYPSGVASPNPGANALNYDLTCQQLADRAFSNAQAAADSINYEAAKKACSAKGYVNGKLAACILGASNQNQFSNPAWCDSQSFSTITSGESKADLVLACKDGLGVVKAPDIPAAVSSCNKGQTAAGCTNTGTTTCAVPGIGWIICPVFTFLAGVADATYGIIDTLLQTDISTVSTNGGTYQAWQVMRNFANAGFVIVFMIIIFSQLSSAGISNYGVKKMLPRLVIGAILVNISFFIGQLAVDLSNILGGSLKDLIDGLPVFSASAAASPSAITNQFSVLTSTLLAGGGILVAGVVGAAAIFGGVGLLIPVLLAAVLAVLITLAILVTRQVLIILLVVISPLAFLAMLLPNTENYFKQWRKMFVAMLLVYPMIALLFGVSHLASAVILSSTSNSATLQTLIGLSVLVLPLFLVPSLLKGSLNAIPAIGNVATKWANRANSNVGKSGKKRLGQSRLGQLATYRRGVSERRRASIQSGTYSGKGGNLNPRNWSTRLNKSVNESSLSGKFGDQASTQGIVLANKIQSEEISNQELLMRTQSTKAIATAKQAGDPNPENAGIAHSENEFRSALKSGDSIKARAAFTVLQSQGQGALEKARKAIEDNPTSDATLDLRQYIQTKHPDMKARDSRINNWVDGKDTAINGSDHLSNLTDTEIASQTPQSIDAGELSPERATRILSNVILRANLKDTQLKALERKGGVQNSVPVDTPPAPTPTPPPAGNESGPSEPVIPNGDGF